MPGSSYEAKMKGVCRLNNYGVAYVLLGNAKRGVYTFVRGRDRNTEVKSYDLCERVYRDQRPKRLFVKKRTLVHTGVDLDFFFLQEETHKTKDQQTFSLWNYKYDILVTHIIQIKI